MFAKQVLAGFVCFGLAGCFTSETPLIAPEAAEFPIATPAVIGEVQADGTSEPLALERDGAAYALIEPTNDGGKPGRKVRHRFVLRGIGDGLFVAQQFGDKGVCPCLFGLIARKGARFELYDFEGFGSSQQLTPEEMGRFGVTLDGDSNYRLSSFDQTAALFRLLLERPRPDNVYELK